MIEVLQKECGDYAKLVKQGGYYKWQEKNKLFLDWLAETTNTLAYAALAYSAMKNYEKQSNDRVEVKEEQAKNSAGGKGKTGNEGAGKSLDDVVVPKDSDLWKQTPDQLKKSKESLTSLIEEHETKLADYIKDPYAYDNKGILSNAPTDEIRNSIIDGRISALNKQITKQKGELDKVLKVLSELGISD